MKHLDKAPVVDYVHECLPNVRWVGEQLQQMWRVYSSVDGKPRAPYEIWRPVPDTDPEDDAGYTHDGR